MRKLNWSVHSDTPLALSSYRGSFYVLCSIATLAVAQNMRELYRLVLIDTPLAPYFSECITSEVTFRGHSALTCLQCTLDSRRDHKGDCPESFYGVGKGVATRFQLKCLAPVATGPNQAAVLANGGGRARADGFIAKSRVWRRSLG